MSRARGLSCPPSSATAAAGYAALARLRDANLAIEADGADAARALYEGIIADTAVPVAYRDVARLHAARLALDGGDGAAVDGLIGTWPMATVPGATPRSSCGPSR